MVLQQIYGIRTLKLVKFNLLETEGQQVWIHQHTDVKTRQPQSSFLSDSSEYGPEVKIQS